MPRVQASVKGRFPEGTSFGAGLFPDEAVAIGATTQAFLVQVRIHVIHVAHRACREA